MTDDIPTHFDFDFDPGPSEGDRPADRPVRSARNGADDGAGDRDDLAGDDPGPRAPKRRAKTFDEFLDQAEAEDRFSLADDGDGSDDGANGDDPIAEAGTASRETAKRRRRAGKDIREAASRRAQFQRRHVVHRQEPDAEPDASPADVPFAPAQRDGEAGDRAAAFDEALSDEALDEPADDRSTQRREAPPDSFDDLLGRQPQRRRIGSGNGLRTGGGLLSGLRELPRPSFDSLRSLRLPRPLPRGGSERVSRPRGGGGSGRISPPRFPRFPGRDDEPRRGRIKRLRLAIILAGLGFLAMVSTVFGMMMAVSQDLPALENEKQYKIAKNSVVVDAQGQRIGTLLSNSQRRLVEAEDIAPSVKQAVVSIEDERFYEHRGVDYPAIARAFISDVIPGGSTQGASTITQQFVKNALEAQGNRTVFQKLRESALAYHLERQWDKDKILTEYLNTIYFGEGAYGIEAAAATYFGAKHPECGGEDTPCASVLEPEEAALLAGLISSPSAYSPRAFPEAAAERRNLVLGKMNDQGVLTEEEYNEMAQASLPAASQIEKPEEDSIEPYFTSWLRQQVVDKYGAGRAFGGGLQIQSTLDLDMQEAVSQIASDSLAGIEPTASVVVIDNKTGGVRAMVGGNDFQEKPFNIATQGHRQAGSAFKPFTLVTALENGHSPGETYASQKKVFPVPNSAGKEKFVVNNYEDRYLGSASIATATTYSDNSVYAELGLNIVDSPQASLNKIEQTAKKMGISTDITGNRKANPAMVLGGLTQGVTPLEMAHAFHTLGNSGKRVSSHNLPSSPGGPVAIEKIKNSDGDVIAENKPDVKQAIDEGAADEAVSILHSVISSGTGEAAACCDDAWGKTGTTENNGDAWFVGGTEDFTAAVWVGHPDSTEPMDTEFAGEPVDGGTYPAIIWSRVMSAVEDIFAAQEAEKESEKESDEDSDDDSGVSSTPSSSPSGGGGSSGGDGGGGGPSHQSAPAPSGGGGGGGGGGVPAGGGSGL